MSLETNKAIVRSLCQIIDNTYVELKYSTYSIDWGKDSSQGKRSGNSIKGSMSDSLGVRFYKGIIMPEMPTEDLELIMNNREKVRYLKAYKNNLSHECCLIYALEAFNKTLT